MSADLSKVRFDPLRDHSGFGIQQGRLWIDADVNEYVAIVDRRLRAQVADLQPNRAAVSRLTPDAFKITVAAGVLSIGAGRMYVDGLLAENHGDTANVAALAFDAVLAELNGSGSINYAAQSTGYWPTPEPLPEAGSYLVYLDVWERERTYLDTPDLVECAIGVDATTRTQTAWQVRAMPLDLPGGAPAPGCDADIADWNALIAPSSARLSTSTVKVADVDDPCDIPPGSGYRGPENQLYRIEMHSATEFKWSRDNASVGSAVTEVVSGTELRLQTLGRDKVLCIGDNDWVEITDDHRELSQRAGEIRQVKVDDDERATITFTDALPADLIPADAEEAAKQHLRVRKWDCEPTAIPMAAGDKAKLEYGIQVEFSSAAGRPPRPGEYWVFSARSAAPSAEESLERLKAAPPRGIHHHYTRLAIVTLPAGTVSDCRPEWPESGGESCACQICVTPEQHNNDTFTVQAAITQLARTGGTITLCPGLYTLHAPLDLAGATSIRIRGCGTNSQLQSGDTAIVLTNCRDIVLEDFAVTTNAGAPTIVLTGDTVACRLHRLHIIAAEGAAVAMRDVHYDLEIEHCRISARTDGVTVIEGDRLLTRGLRINDNTFNCAERGIDFSVGRDPAGHGPIMHVGTTSISGNTLTGCAEGAVAVTGLIPPPPDTRSERTLDICGNTIEADGIAIAAGPNVRIAHNTITAPDRTARQHGIIIEASPPDSVGNTAQVLANIISGVGGVGISAAAPIRNLTIADNTVRGAAAGITVTARGISKNVSITNNEILDIKPNPQAEPWAVFAVAPPGSVLGIIVTGATTVTITGNTVDQVAADDHDQAQPCLGIAVRGCGTALISGNTVSRIGHPNIGRASGIAAAAWRESITIAGNTVLNGVGPTADTVRNWIAVRLSSDDDPDLDTITAATANGKLVIVQGLAFQRPDSFGHAHIDANTLHGAGRAPAVIATVDGDLIMTGNGCAQPSRNASTVADITAKVALLQGNRLFGGDPSMRINADPDKVSVIGNIATGAIEVNGTPIDMTGNTPTPLNTNA